MNQLSLIKNQLKLISGEEFQELCDLFLSLRHRGHKAFARSGVQNTKQKTTKLA